MITALVKPEASLPGFGRCPQQQSNRSTKKCIFFQNIITPADSRKVALSTFEGNSRLKLSQSVYELSQLVHKYSQLVYKKLVAKPNTTPDFRTFVAVST
jgi:hypothetical protein